MEAFRRPQALHMPTHIAFRQINPRPALYSRQ